MISIASLRSSLFQATNLIVLINLLALKATLGLGSTNTAPIVPTTTRFDYMRIVGRTHQQVPGLPEGAIFRNRGGGSGFFDPVINNKGQVAFYGRIDGTGVTNNNDNGIWLETDGVLQLVARQTDEAYDPSTGNTLQHPGDPYLNNAGQLAFTFSLQGPANNGEALWSYHNGLRELVARIGASAPGTPPGSIFIREDGIEDSTVMNDAGDIAFWSNVEIPGSTISTSSGVWLWRNDQLMNLAHTGAPAPDVPPEVIHTSISFPTINASGAVAFSGQLNGPGINSNNDTAIWIYDNGSVETVMREGSPTPLAGINFGRVQARPRLNSLGDIMFGTTMQNQPTGQDSALWATHGGVLQLVASEGGQAGGLPDGVVITSNSFQFPVMNNRGEVAFSGAFSGPSESGVTAENNSGIWIWRDGQTELVVREGDAAMGLEPGVVIDGLFANHLLLNGRGQLAFIANLRGPGVDHSNRLAVLATDEQGIVHTILRTGDQIDSGVFGLVPVLTLSLYDDTGNGDGFRSSFNDRGQVAIRYALGGGNIGGILVSNLVAIPEPATVVLAMIAVVVALAWKGLSSRKADLGLNGNS